MRCTGSGMPTRFSNAIARARFSARARSAWRNCTSTICVPIVSTGLSVLMGSWNTIEMRSPRSARIASSGNANRSMPSNRIVPATMRAEGASKRNTARLRVDLPDPLSPTNPTIRPRSMEKRISRRAWMGRCDPAKSTERPSISRSGAISDLFAEPRIDGVPQRLAEEGEPERRQHQRQSARQDDPGRVADEGIAVVEHRAPARRRRPHAEAQKAQPCLDGDHHGNVHAREDEERPDDVRHHMHRQDARGAGTQRALRQDELGVLQRLRLRAHDPAVARREGHDDDHDYGLEARSDQRYQREREHNGRKGADSVEDQHKDAIEPSGAIARGEAERAP